MIMNITVKFLEPFRMLEWTDPDKRAHKNRKFMRGQAFARWHKRAQDKGGGERPYITGTLVRSAVIRSAENLLLLSGGQVGEKKCCPGKFRTENQEKKEMMLNLRQRSTLKWTTQETPCDSAPVCPLCELLGRRFDDTEEVRKKTKENDPFRIHFGNLSPLKWYGSPSDIATQRTLNRVDYSTGKAHDFFTAWEIDNSLLSVFQGEITIDDEVNREAIKLLTDSLRFTDRLCGALCVISCEENENSAGEKHSKPDAEKTDAEDFIQKIADSIEESEKFRILADAVRALRTGKDTVSQLPCDHEDKENHHLWDIGEEKSIRTLLREKAESLPANQWRKFCEDAGEMLYLKSKDLIGGLTVSQRILGEDAFWGKADRQLNPSAVSIPATKETLICGKLISETPFFFGTEIEDAKHTNLKVLLDRQNRYRLPRSAIRGVLRRDLRTAFGGKGCNVELGGRPCLCNVCRIMRCITIMDARSDYAEPPEIRHRIRLNPYTGTVAEGALFDMEVGPQGLSFDFILRYRGKGKSIPKALKNVLKWWSEGQAFLSGATSTGKGRFRLDGMKHIPFDLSDKDKRKEYLENYGWRDRILTELSNELPLEELSLEMNDYTEPLWQRVSVKKIEIGSPFLNGDPIRALIEKDGGDIVSFRKYADASGKEVYAYKAESFRGVVRAALARQFDEDGEPLPTLIHQDCECLICRLFGSEHETGRLRFEDLEFDPQPEPVIFDHVAIDRFTGGAVDKKKFDDCSLPGTPGHPLTLKGCFWIRKESEKPDKDKEEREALGKALADIQNGLYPMGGKGAIGYGWVTSLKIEGAGDVIEAALKNESSDGTECEHERKKADSELKLSLDDGKAVYYPHYFLKPASGKVNRKPIPTGHETLLHSDLLTGKIRCRLTTLTPLIVPDTSNDDFFQTGVEGHESYAFFSVNDEIMLPGSEIRGMISSVYEALTNSCFRIFDEGYRLSWRMTADKNVLTQFKPGRVTDDGRIEGMKEYRYPFYDKDCPDQKSQDACFDEWERSISLTDHSLEEIEKAAGKKGYVSPKDLKVLKSLKGIKYKSTEGLLEAFKDKGGGTGGDILSLIFKHAERIGDVPRYEHPTDTDRMMLSLAECNRNQKSDRKRAYKIIKPASQLGKGAYFMFAGTPVENKRICGPACADKANRYVEGYLKISGPNKLEKYNISEPELDGVPEGKNCQIIHNRIYLRKIFVANAKKRKERDRLVGEFACYDPEKKVTYSMTKRCERIFIKDRGRMFPITQEASELFEILVKEYRENAKRQDTPEVFQTLLPDNGRLNPGDLVYFCGEKGKAVEIIPVRISRKIDDRLIGKRLRKDLRPCHGEWIEGDDLSQLSGYPEKKLFTRNTQGLCPACRLFGTGAYKGRLRFGFAKLENDPKWLRENQNDPSHGDPLTLPLLERPRPSWSMPDDTPERLRKDGNPKQKKQKCKDKNEGPPKVPGRKFYVHHDGWKVINSGCHPTTKEKIVRDQNNRTVEPLDKGNTFTFEIAFENLEPHELGLLLYTLELEKGLAHKLGMAKPMGFGSIDIEVENVSLRTDSGQWEDANERISEWTDEGKREAGQWFNTDWDAAEHIKNLKKLLCLPGEEQNPRVIYPALKQKDIPDSQIPGYEELKKNFRDKNKKQNRSDLLTTPWMPWHPIQQEQK
ncbi:type III-E CRISPR-associated gRAMP effector Cas7-11 [Desulfobacterales bacterium HSG2]|nr:type III-E CRISPR-associated gRAMP effector Cas7-11 [Desulfobacterales bacterium HSG2]